LLRPLHRPTLFPYTTLFRSRIPRILARLRMRTHECTLRVRSIPMTTIKVGVREFRERIASFLESDTPVAVTRRGETLGVYVPTRDRKSTRLNSSHLVISYAV